MPSYIQLALSAALVCAAYGLPQQYSAQQYSSQSQTTPIPIIAQSQEGPNPDGSYAYSYQTGNGIQVEERNQPQVNKDEINNVVTGYFAYPGEDGQQIVVQYVADADGFRAQGPHLPTPVPLTPEQQEAHNKALAEAANDPQQYDDNGFPIGGPGSQAPQYQAKRQFQRRRRSHH